MSISIQDRLPEANLFRLGEAGPEAVALSSLTAGKRLVIFAVPGAYTPTCSNAHMPSYIENAQAFADKGVELICVTVNDPFVSGAWARDTGADKAGITVLADPASELTTAIGMDFTAPPAGLYARSKRYAMLVEDGVVKALHVEENPGACSVSAGPSLLDEV